MATSTDKDTSSEAIKNADKYLKQDAKSSGQSTHGQDRTVINRSPLKSTEHAQSTSTAAAGTAADMGKLIKNRLCKRVVKSISAAEAAEPVRLVRL